jgi:MFS family permease
VISVALSAKLRRFDIHYGWAVVFATFLTMLVMAGAMGSAGVLIAPLQAEFGWKTSEISSALAIRFLLYGFLGPFAAAFMNHFGIRRVVITALMIVLSGLLASMLMRHLWQLMLLWGVVVGIGTGLTAMVLGATVTTRWFSARRGLVMGILAASSATGQLVFLPLMANLTDQYGWRITLSFVCAMIGISALIVLALLRDRPIDMGLPMYGDKQLSLAPNRKESLSAMLLSPLTTLREVSRTGAFWILFGTFFICGASTNGLIQTHFVSFCGDYGLVPVIAASVLAMMGIFDFFGTIGSGWLSDRFDSRSLLAMYYGLRGLALMYLPFADFTFEGLSIFALFYGLDWIATVPPTVKLATQNFGPGRANIVFGWIFTGHQIGAAFAAYGAGLTRTLLSSYLPAFFAAGLLCIVAAGAILFIGLKPVQRVDW